MKSTPFQQIQDTLKHSLPSTSLKVLPKKWEKIGSILLLKLPKNLEPSAHMIGQTYAHVLGCTTVLQDTGGIAGVLRQPKTKIIYGSKKTTTTHVENGVTYNLDPQLVMFSSGNMDERIRMATMSNPKETVVDLFAGIGYFTIPLAVYSKPQHIYACELNPVAYDFLVQNCRLNKVDHIVYPLLGDNRITAPRGIADRVIMGHFEEPVHYLPLGIECLKPKGGMIHYHMTLPQEKKEKQVHQEIQYIADQQKKKIRIHQFHRVKSFAPCINHVVVDLQVTST